MPRAMEQQSPCTMTGPALQSPCSKTREATTMRSLHHAKRVAPALCKWRKPTCSNEDPAQPKERNQSKALRMTDIKKTKFCAEHGETNQSPHALLVGRQDGAAAAEDRLVALRGNTAAATTQQLHFWVHTREKTCIHTETRYRDAHSSSIHNRQALTSRHMDKVWWWCSVTQSWLTESP